MSSRAKQPPPEEQEERSSKQANRPVFKQRCFTGGGNVEVAVFERAAPDDKPDQPSTYYVAAKKSFKDDSGAWREVSVFQPHELLVLARAVTAAYDWIAQQQTT